MTRFQPMKTEDADGVAIITWDAPTPIPRKIHENVMSIRGGCQELDSIIRHRYFQTGHH